MNRVEIYKDQAGEWRWRLKAANGEIVASGEGFTRKADAVRAWHDVRAAVHPGIVVEVDEVAP